ncbi:MalY/PatB family protein [Dysosmobacter acutus]|nr:MalY/PatB family protein [Dysosmobacter acutus]
MNQYNFDLVIDRTKSDCAKWSADSLNSYFGKEDLLPLWVADMDFEVAPAIKRAVVQRAEHGIYGYSTRPHAYYEAAINWIRRRFGYRVEEEWIVYSPGVVPAICNLLQALCRKGDKVLIQEPVYYPFKAAIESNGFEVVVSELKNNGQFYEMDFEDFAEKARDPRVGVFILCNPHNPVSRLWTRGELERIGSICLENNVVVISDEIHSDLIYPGWQHTMFASISDAFAMNSATCMSPSKTFNLAGMQASNIIIPNGRIRDKYLAVQLQNNTELQNPFSIVASIAAYNEGEAWLEELLNYLVGNIAYIHQYLSDNLPLAHMIDPQATYLGWIDFRAYEADGKALENVIYHKAKVAMDGGTWFGRGGSGFMRINFACPRETLKMGLDRIAKTIHETYGSPPQSNPCNPAPAE